MKCVLSVCVAVLALVSGCASVVETSAVSTTSASLSAPVVSASKPAARVATVRTESSLRTTAAMKTRCESGDDSACLVAASFER